MGLWPTLLLLPLLCSAGGLGPFPQPQATTNMMDTEPKIRPDLNVPPVTAVVGSTISVVFCSFTIKPELKFCNANFGIIYVYTQNLLSLNTDLFSEQKVHPCSAAVILLFCMFLSYFSRDFLPSPSCTAHFEVLE